MSSFLFFTILPVSLQFFQRPGVVAGGVAYEEGTEAGIAGPAEIFCFEEFFVGVALDELHDVGVAFFEEGFGRLEACFLMVFPEHDVHCAVGFPAVIWRQN